MPPPTNSELNDRRERDCFSVTPERKYYRTNNGKTFVKRSLRPSEWQQHNGYLHVPIFNAERILNEGACLQYLAEHTDIPVPCVHACFEDDGAAYLVTEYVEGVGMDELEEADRKKVVVELEQHLVTLRTLTSDTWGGPGPGGGVYPPYRVLRHSDRRPWRLRREDGQDSRLVFCHNDLQAANVLVDPASLKITAIVDWEYAGFYPAQFERRFYLRDKPGPSIALPGEEDDEAELQALLDAARE